jgi:hypothetical protein
VIFAVIVLSAVVGLLALALNAWRRRALEAEWQLRVERAASPRAVAMAAAAERVRCSRIARDRGAQEIASLIVDEGQHA